MNRHSILNLVDSKKRVVSDIFKYSDDGSKYFIGYLHGDRIMRPLFIILPRMSGYIKYFDNGGKSVSFKIEDKGLSLKYNEIWIKTKKTLNTKLYIQPIYDDKYITTKVKVFDGVINRLFSDNKIPEE